MAVRRDLYHPEEVREKIKTSQIINRLNLFVRGKISMAPHQVTAALGLLKKTMPDLTAVALSGHLEMTKADELADSLLAHIATGGSAGATGQAPSPNEPSEVH
jgi:hypothetical protein